MTYWLDLYATDFPDCGVRPESEYQNLSYGDAGFLHQKFDEGDMRRFPKILDIFTQTPRTMQHDVMAVHHTLIVSHRTREIIESLEPGVHQFVELTAKLSPALRRLAIEKGLYRDLRYSWLNVCQSANAVDKDQSNLRLQVVPGWKHIPAREVYHIERPVKITLRREKIANFHLWGTNKSDVAGYELFVSDKLRDVMVAQGVGPMTFVKCQEIDR